MNCNPQVENGFTAISNEVMEALSSFRLSGQEWQCLCVILRKTYGWNKKTDAISLDQFSLLSKMVRPHIVRSLKNLLSKKVITITKNGNRLKPNTYGFNKHYDQWVLSKKVIRVTKKGTYKNNNKNNNTNTKEILKKSYGEFNNVLLTDDQFRKLADKFGEQMLQQRIQNTSEYFQLKGKKAKEYTDHYLCILRWARKDEPPNSQPEILGDEYDAKIPH